MKRHNLLIKLELSLLAHDKKVQRNVYSPDINSWFDLNSYGFCGRRNFISLYSIHSEFEEHLIC